MPPRYPGNLKSTEFGTEVLQSNISILTGELMRQNDGYSSGRNKSGCEEGHTLSHRLVSSEPKFSRRNKEKDRKSKGKSFDSESQIVVNDAILDAQFAQTKDTKPTETKKRKKSKKVIKRMDIQPIQTPSVAEQRLESIGETVQETKSHSNEITKSLDNSTAFKERSIQPSQTSAQVSDNSKQQVPAETISQKPEVWKPTDQNLMREKLKRPRCCCCSLKLGLLISNIPLFLISIFGIVSTITFFPFSITYGTLAFLVILNFAGIATESSKLIFWTSILMVINWVLSIIFHSPCYSLGFCCWIGGIQN